MLAKALCGHYVKIYDNEHEVPTIWTIERVENLMAGVEEIQEQLCARCDQDNNPALTTAERQ